MEAKIKSNGVRHSLALQSEDAHESAHLNALYKRLFGKQVSGLRIEVTYPKDTADIRYLLEMDIQ